MVGPPRSLGDIGVLTPPQCQPHRIAPNTEDSGPVQGAPGCTFLFNAVYFVCCCKKLIFLVPSPCSYLMPQLLLLKAEDATI